MKVTTKPEVLENLKTSLKKVMEGHGISGAQKSTNPEQNFREQAMLNHSYLRSIIDKEVS